MDNWPCHQFYGLWAISPFFWPFWPILHLTNPQANTLVLGLGGPFGLPGASGPSSHHQGLWPNPFDYGVYGLNGLFGPFRSPTAFTPMACGNHQRPPAQVQPGFPSIQGKTSTSSMYPVPKDPGMVHIWYNIPLFTIFAQPSNGDVFRTKLCLFNQSPQIHHPFQRKTFQSFSLAIPGGYQKTI
ncbi:hypothetical protein O181_068179 [Austropuccinia psidii MF-1]|uniref:Uncharacterized protein n=1 Tax=Austropuccinia psidii MF-1 TaxID=1389203 RepID=A0A9Q3EWE2_9BASI|nr:hypothetical protein [Austropuccinia psidii MF-1]